MLTYVTINLFESPAQTLVNTVNTVGVMGKGIAATFRQLYPEMYQEYRLLCQQGKLNVGMLYIYRTPNKIIVNFPTKKHWRQRSQVEYIKAGLRKFTERYTDYGISSVSFPQLGCGHGELDWQIQVQPLMEQYLGDLPIPVYIHLYPKSHQFVPERLSVDYAKQIRLERQRISTNQLWTDLHELVVTVPDQAYLLTLFGPQVQVNDEHILFRPIPGQEVVIYREDIEDLWNILRLRGTLRETDVPESIREDGAEQWLFELLQRLDYIKPIMLRSRSEGTSTPGLRYDPRSETNLLSPVEVIV